MFRGQRPCAFLFFALLSYAVATAQEKPSVSPQPTSPPITVAASGARVRFAAIGAVERMRLEVFDPSGSPVFDSGFKPGNVRDWPVVGTDGRLLPDSTYLCVVTVRELSGRLSFKQGTILVEGGQASLALDGSGQPERIGPERETLAARRTAEPTAMTVAAHDGEEGQVTSTTGPLTFRTGDVFTGQDRERMRLTEDGKLGVGTTDPQATLDVAGTVRASKGVTFPDGTVLTSATGRAQKMDANGEPEPLVAGTGTTGKLVKWTNGPAGTLGDSVVTEAGGKIGVGVAAPNNPLHVNGAIELGAAGSVGVNPTLGKTSSSNAGVSLLTFYPASGTNTNMSFAIVPRGNGLANNRAQFALHNTDIIANPSNSEFAGLRARGTDFVFGTGGAGGGLNRPLMLAAGFLTNNSTNNGQLFLATNGDVGVGTTAPVSKFHVDGPVKFLGLRTEKTETTPNVVGGYNNNFVTAGAGGASIGGGGSTDNFPVGPNRVTDNFGTVGGGNNNQAGDNAGTISDRQFATVGGGLGNSARGTSSTVPGGLRNVAQGDYSFAAGNSASALHKGTFVWSDAGTNFQQLPFTSTGPNQFLIRALGGVGINTDSPTTDLDVGGSTNVRGSLSVNGTIKFGNPTAGNGERLCRASSGLIVDCSISSVRYKRNITGLRLGLDTVRRLRPVSFTWKEDGQRDIGLVAEEVGLVDPLLVTRNEAGEIKGVKYDHLPVLLIKAVQEQQEQIKRQQAEIEALKQLVCPAHPNAAVCKQGR